MQMHKHAERLAYFCAQLRTVAASLADKPPKHIGYRERLLVERPLFLVMKEVCRRRLGYDLRGLSEVHRLRLESAIQGNTSTMRVQNLLREAFEIRVFLIDLSSANPYVQGDALSRASLQKEDVVKVLSRSLYRMAGRFLDEEGE
jgi:hypothetical protein